MALAVFPLALSAQNAVWNERIDSSVIQARRVRPEMTAIPINTADLRRTASPMGEADPIKFIQTLPGVATGMEGSSAYYVRGGNDVIPMSFPATGRRRNSGNDCISSTFEVCCTFKLNSPAVLPMKSERGTITILRSPRPSRPL